MGQTPDQSQDPLPREEGKPPTTVEGELRGGRVYQLVAIDRPASADESGDFFPVTPEDPPKYFTLKKRFDVGDCTMHSGDWTLFAFYKSEVKVRFVLSSSDDDDVWLMYWRALGPGGGQLMRIPVLPQGHLSNYFRYELGDGRPKTYHGTHKNQDADTYRWVTTVEINAKC